MIIYRLKSSVTTSRYLYWYVGVTGLIGPTRSACNRLSSLDVLIGWSLCFAGGLVALPFSQASHRGLVSSLKKFYSWVFRESFEGIIGNVPIPLMEFFYQFLVTGYFRNPDWVWLTPHSSSSVNIHNIQPFPIFSQNGFLLVYLQGMLSQALPTNQVAVLWVIERVMVFDFHSKMGKGHDPYFPAVEIVHHALRL